MSGSAAWLAWAWVPITIGAALAQTARNAAQRSLVAQAGTLGATLVRFLYGLPFAAAWVLLLHVLPATAADVPSFNAGYFVWVALGGVTQIAATALLLAVMRQRNFVIGVAYSKTDALQVALFGALLLRDLPGWATLVAIALATAGVILLSLPKGAGELRAWTGSAALYGVLSGAGFALSAVAYRAATLEVPQSSPWLAAAWSVLWAQAIQTVVLGGWLAWRSPAVLGVVTRAWRVSTLAGAMGALASIGWFTGFALTSAANVRTVGLVEVVFSYLVSHRLLREQLSAREAGGLLLVTVGLVALFATL